MPDSGEWRKIIAYLESTGVPFRAVSTYRPGAITATGNPSRHGMGLAVDFAGPRPGRDTVELWRINQAFKPVAHLLHELIYSGPNSYQVYNGRPHYYTGVTRDNHHDHVHVSIDAGTVLPGQAKEEEVPAAYAILCPKNTATSVPLPVIGSLEGRWHGGWISFASDFGGTTLRLAFGMDGRVTRVIDDYVVPAGPRRIGLPIERGVQVCSVVNKGAQDVTAWVEAY